MYIYVCDNWRMYEILNVYILDEVRIYVQIGACMRRYKKSKSTKNNRSSKTRVRPPPCPSLPVLLLTISQRWETRVCFVLVAAAAAAATAAGALGVDLVGGGQLLRTRRREMGLCGKGRRHMMG